MERKIIRGIRFSNVTMGEALNQAKTIIESPKKTAYAIYTPNAEICQMCLDDKSGRLLGVINSADMILPDGAGVILASKILKNSLKEKVAGIDFAYSLLEYMDKNNKSLFLLGSTEESLTLAKSNLAKNYPGLRISGTRDGFFNLDSVTESEKIINEINSSETDVVFVCFGAPKQELWIYRNRDMLNSAILIGLGGTIDAIAGRAKRAPKIFIKLNLEWFYRLCKNPHRIGRMMKLPKYIIGTFLSGGRSARHSP